MIGSIAITNSNSESASPWKTPLRISTTAKLCAPAINSTFYFFITSVLNFVGYLVHFPTMYYLDMQDYIQGLSFFNPYHGYYFSSRLALLEDVLIIL